MALTYPDSMLNQATGLVLADIPNAENQFLMCTRALGSHRVHLQFMFVYYIVMHPLHSGCYSASTSR